MTGLIFFMNGLASVLAMDVGMRDEDVGLLVKDTVISELATLKLSQLRQRALDSNYDADKVDEAIDSDNPRAALAELILSQVPVSMIAVQQTKHGDDDTTAPNPSCSNEALFTWSRGETKCTVTCDCGGNQCYHPTWPQYCRRDSAGLYTVSYYPNCYNPAFFTWNGGETQCNPSCECGANRCNYNSAWPQYCRCDDSVSYCAQGATNPNYRLDSVYCQIPGNYVAPQCSTFTHTGSDTDLLGEPLIEKDLGTALGDILMINSVRIKLSDGCGGNTWPTVSFSSAACNNLRQRIGASLITGSSRHRQRIIDNSEGNVEPLPNNVWREWNDLTYICADGAVSDWRFNIEEVDKPKCAANYEYTVSGFISGR